MSKEIKEKIYNSYLITISHNETEKEGKYCAYGRKVFGKANPKEAAINLPTYKIFGDDPDELINQVKLKIDRVYENK